MLGTIARARGVYERTTGTMEGVVWDFSMLESPVLKSSKVWTLPHMYVKKHIYVY